MHFFWLEWWLDLLILFHNDHFLGNPVDFWKHLTFFPQNFGMKLYSRDFSSNKNIHKIINTLMPLLT